MSLDSIRFEGGFYPLSEYTIIKMTGNDREGFIQNQLTNDFSSLKVGEGQVSCRLDRGGRIQFYCFPLKSNTESHLVILKELAQEALEDLDKVLIMEDVELEILEEDLFVAFDPQLKYSLNQSDDFETFQLEFFGEMGQIGWGPEFKTALEKLKVPKIDEESMNQLRILNGFPKWNQEISSKTIVNYSFLNEVAVDYKKGCFLGQETIAKIENNRGAGNYPVLFQTEGNNEGTISGEDVFSGDKKIGSVLNCVNYEGKTYLSLNLPRTFRIKNKNFDFKIGDGLMKGKVFYLPFFNEGSLKNKSQAFFHRAVELFQLEKNEEAKDNLLTSIKLDPSFPDAYESLGVILGREGKYSEAIKMMDQLLEKDPDSVMAHTNKSLYFMKMGKIDEAEAEKDKATAKEFKKIGEEAKQEARVKEEEAQKEADLKRREEMFIQVLEMDNEDELANFGLGDISYKRGEFLKAKGHLEKVLSHNSKHSMSYLLLGKSLLGLGEDEEAKKIFVNGIKVASGQGDLMPANEMQVHLNKL